MLLALTNYVFHNYVFLFLCTGLFIVLEQNPSIGKKSVRGLKPVLLLLLALSVADAMEVYTSRLSYPTRWRVIFSIVGYALRPVIAYIVLGNIMERGRLYHLLSIPALLNVLIYLTALFSPIAFSYGSANTFHRGPLGYSIFVIGFLYLLIILFAAIIRYSMKDLSTGIIVLVCTLACVTASVLEKIIGKETQVLIRTMAISFVFYYIYMQIQLTKLDAATGLFNRQSFYTYIDRYGASLSAAISVDMNGLKRLNDLYGHSEGDKGIRAIGQALDALSSSRNRVFRVGGDEFIITCIGQDEVKLARYVEFLRNAVARSGYSASFGFAYRGVGESTEELLKRADDAMYAEKRAYYSNRTNDRRNNR